MKIISYKGLVFEDEGFWAGPTDETGRGAWGVAPSITPRRGVDGEITGVTIDPKTITIEIGYDGNAWDSADEAFYWLMGQLNPTQDGTGELIGQMNFNDDADQPIFVRCDAVITGPGIQTDDSDVNVIAVTFVSTQSAWQRTVSTVEISGTIDNATFGGLTIDVAGMAPVPAAVRLTPVALDNQVTLQTFTISNISDQPMVIHPVKVDFGYQGDGFVVGPIYYACLLDGVPQRAEFINFGGPQAYLWVVVPYLAPGDTAHYTVITSNNYALSTPGFNSYTQPAFNFGWLLINSTSGSTTTFVNSSATWETNQWRGGNLTILDGSNYLVTRTIISNTATTLTTDAFPNAIGGGLRGLIHMSSNGKWVYQTRQTERNNNQRGVWWIDQGQKKPSDWRFDVPGGFAPYLYYNNNDQKVQTPYTEVNVGTKDFFSILNAWRTWKDGPAIKSNWLGNADGVTLSMPFPITSVRMTERLRNPNSMCKFIVGSRALGADEFIEEYVNSAPYASLTDVAVHTVSMTSGTTQIYLGLIPGLDADGNQKDEIGKEWGNDDGTATIGETGTASSATSTTLVDSSKSWVNDLYNGYRVLITGGTGYGQERSIVDTLSGNTIQVAAWGTTPDSTSQYTIMRRTKIEDSTKNWVVDQWIDGVARIVSGRGRGASAVITDSDATSVTANFNVNLDSTSRYTLTAKGTQAIARMHDIFEVNWDATNLVVSKPTLWARGYVLDRELYLDRPTASANPSYQRHRFSYPFTGRHIVLNLGESLVIDGASMTAWIDATRPSFVATNVPVAMTNGTNTLSIPNNTEPGDTILAVVQNSNAAVLTPPSGWVEIASKAVGATSYRVFKGKRTDINNSVTFVYGSAPSAASIFMVAYRNLRGAAPDSSNSNNTTGTTTHAAGSVTISDPYTMFVNILITSGAVTVTGAPSGTTAHAIDTTHFVYDGVKMNAAPAQSYPFTTNTSTNAVVFALVFAPDADLINVPPRSVVVQDVEQDGTERLAERWLELTPGQHPLMLSAVAAGNDYVMEVDYKPGYFA